MGHKLTPHGHIAREPRVQPIGRHPPQASDPVPVNLERYRPRQTTLYRLVGQHAACLIVTPRRGPAPSCLDSSKTSSTTYSSVGLACDDWCAKRFESFG